MTARSRSARAFLVIGDDPEWSIEKPRLPSLSSPLVMMARLTGHLARIVALEGVLPVLGVTEIDPFDVWRQLGRIESVRGVPNGGRVTWGRCGLGLRLGFSSAHEIQSSLAHRSGEEDTPATRVMDHAAPITQRGRTRDQ